MADVNQILTPEQMKLLDASGYKVSKVMEQGAVALPKGSEFIASCPDGRQIKIGLTFSMRDYVYDTVFIDAQQNAVTLNQGFERKFFANLANKGIEFTNCTRPNEIPANIVFGTFGCGWIARTHVGNVRPSLVEQKKVLDNTYLEVKVDKNVLHSVAMHFVHGGVGFSGYTTENDDGVVTNGTPAMGSVIEYEKPVILDKESRIEVSLKRGTNGTGLGVDESGSAPVVPDPVIAKGNLIAVTFFFFGIRIESASKTV